MASKYEGLICRQPENTAKIVGKVEKSNYLAHSIREIEFAIFKAKQENYHIVTHIAGPGLEKSKVYFFKRGCIIYLPNETEEMDDRRIRLILAHELGHIIFNIEHVLEPGILDNAMPSNEEELFSWEFAFHLIKMKSDDLKNDEERKRFAYYDDDLKKALSVIVRTKKPEIYDDIVKSLSLPKFK